MIRSRNPRPAALSLLLPLIATAVLAQSPPAEHSATLVIRAAQVLDVRTGTYIKGAAIYIVGDRIRAVGPAAEVLRGVPGGARMLDLGAVSVLPGLIDCHTHLMARFSDDRYGYELGLLTKSQAFRALEGAADARLTLEAGFTTVRDVENEGSGYADVALRDAINQGLVEGPRMRVATRGIAALGQYHPFEISPDLTGFPTGVQMISGTEEARRAVREQIGNGADLIKVYADWRYPTLTVAEMQVIVEEAHKAGRRVAAHATTPEGIRNAVQAGVDSIEHGHRADRAALEAMKARGVYLVPTLAVVDADIAADPEAQASPKVKAFLEGIQRAVRTAKELGVKIADGSDPASAERHGKNAEELAAMTQRGLTPLEAIRSATINGADLIGWPDDIGALEAGKYADLIAVRGDPLADITVLQQVPFVMKGGKVVKNELAACECARRE